MKTNKYLTLSLLAAGISVSAAGFAADTGSASDHGPDHQAVFKKLDTNHDGKLSAAEMTKLPQVMQQQMLAKIDTNHDGKIEKSEFEAQAKARADRMFAKMDKNGDGSLSASELKPPMGHPPMGPHHAGHMPPPPPPANGDAPPPPPKPDAQPPKPGEQQADAGQPHQGGHHHRWHHGPRHHHGMPSTDQIFAHMDTNNDGFVSAAEWNQAAQKWHHHGQHKPGEKPAPQNGQGDNAAQPTPDQDNG